MPNTREKLIELLETVASPNELLCDGEVRVSTSRVADHLIANGVTVQGDKDINVPSKWIPVTERLPEISGDYLAYCGDGYIGVLSYSTQYKLFNTFDGCGKKFAIAVTHWMPLPEPPKGE